MSEIEAMAAIDGALAGLDDDAARLRVIEWAVSKHVAPANVRLQTMHREAESAANDAVTAYHTMMKALAEMSARLNIPAPRLTQILERLVKEVDAEDGEKS